MKKKILSLLLTLVMILSMLPLSAITASAASDPDIYVAGVLVPSGYYLSESGELSKSAPSDGWAHVSGEFLELYNFDYEGPGYKYGYYDYALIYGTGTFYLDYSGTNVLKSSNGYNQYSKGIYSNGGLKVREDNDYDGTLTIDVNDCGIYAQGYIFIYRDGIVDITAGQDGIYSNLSAVEIYETDVRINAVYNGIYGYYYSDYAVSVVKSDLTINAGANGIVGDNNCVHIGNSSLDITAYENGIYGYSGIKVNLEGGTKTVEVRSTNEGNYDYSYSALSFGGSSEDLKIIGKTKVRGASTEHDGRIREYNKGSNYLYDYVIFSPIHEITIGDYVLADGDYLTESGVITNRIPDADYAYYNNDTLTLKNFDFIGEPKKFLKYNDNEKTLIYSPYNLKINLMGYNTLKSSSPTAATSLIWGHDNVTIAGGGTLDLCEAAGALYAYKNLTINAGNLNIDVSGVGIETFGSGGVTLNDGNVVIKAEDGINTDKLNLYGGSLIIKPRENSYSAHGMYVDYFNVYGGTLNITTNDSGTRVSTGIFCNNGNFLIRGGKVDITAEGTGIHSISRLSAVKGGELTIDSHGKGIAIDDPLSVDTKKTLEFDGGKTLITADYGIYLEEHSLAKVNGGMVTIYSSIDGIYVADDVYDDEILENVVVNGGVTKINSTKKGMNLTVGNIKTTGGELNISSKDVGILAYDINLNGGVIDVTAPKTAVSATNNLCVNGAELTAESTSSYGLYAGNGNVVISDGDVTVSSVYDGIYSNYGNVTVEGGTLYVDSDRHGIQSYRGAVNIVGGNVEVEAVSNGIIGQTALTVKTNKLNVMSTNTSSDNIYCALYTNGTLNMTDEHSIYASTSPTGNIVVYNASKNDTYDYIEIYDTYDVTIDGVVLYNNYYLAQNSTTPSKTKPLTGYAYRNGDKLYLYGFNKQNAEIVFRADDFEIICQGGSSNIGAIIDYDDIHDKHYNLKITTEGSSNLNVTGYRSDGWYGTIRTDGDLTLNGEIIILDDAWCLENVETLNVTGGVVRLNTAEERVFGTETEVKVTGGLLELINDCYGEFAANLSVNQGDTYVLDYQGNYGLEYSEKWNGESDLSQYDVIYIIPTPEPLYIGDTVVNEGDYVLESGVVTSTVQTDNYAYYNGGILTLKNFDYRGEGYSSFNYGTPRIFATEDLIIKLQGKNSIVSSGLTATGIYCDKELTINGGGSLSVELKDADRGNTCIWAERGMVIEDVDININSKRTAFESNKVSSGYDNYTTINNSNITINTSGSGFRTEYFKTNNSTFNINAGANGFYGFSQEFNNCNININSDKTGIKSNGSSIKITQSDVKIVSQNETGIETGVGQVTLDGGTYDITGYNYAIFAGYYYDFLLISGQLKATATCVNANETSCAIACEKNIIIPDNLTAVAWETLNGNFSNYATSLNDTYKRVVALNFGDINCDNEVNIRDLVALKKQLVNNESVFVADLNFDGSVNAYDLILTRKTLLKAF